jgi:levanase/fructan beta-fructosidase
MKQIKKINIVFIILVMLLTSCKKSVNKNLDGTQVLEQASYTEEDLYRPNFHFTPKSGWMNDPNGMFFYNEYYHLYFQR